MKEIIKKYYKVGAALIIIIAIVIGGVLYYRSKIGRPVSEFIPKSSHELCEVDYDLSTAEVLKKLTDTLYHEGFESLDFRKDPIAYIMDSILIFTEDGVEKFQPNYAVGYTYNTVMASYLTAVYYNDPRIMSVYGNTIEFLYRNSIEFVKTPTNGTTLYWHQNRDSACFPLMFDDDLGEQSVNDLKDICYALYAFQLSFPREVEDALCPVSPDTVAMLNDLTKKIDDFKVSDDLGSLSEEYGLKPQNFPGRANDMLILYEHQSDVDENAYYIDHDSVSACTRDAYFVDLGNAVYYMLADAKENEGLFHEEIMMEILNTISNGISSGVLTEEEVSALNKLKLAIFKPLEAATKQGISYSIYEPYGELEISYMEICMRDKDFFLKLDDGAKLGYSYEFDNSCDFESVLIKNMVDTACEMNNGEEMYLYSPIVDLQEGGRRSVASVPNSLRLLVNFLILQKRDEAQVD